MHHVRLQLWWSQQTTSLRTIYDGWRTRHETPAKDDTSEKACATCTGGTTAVYEHHPRPRKHFRYTTLIHGHLRTSVNLKGNSVYTYSHRDKIHRENTQSQCPWSAEDTIPFWMRNKNEFANKSKSRAQSQLTQ